MRKERRNNTVQKKGKLMEKDMRIKGMKGERKNGNKGQNKQEDIDRRMVEFSRI